MKVNFLGWYGRDNLGDEAFKLAHNELFPSVERVYTVDHLDKSADLVVLGGGDVVKSFYLNKIPERVPYYAFGVGMGYDSEVELFKKKPPVHAYMRSHHDTNLASDNGIKANFTPDITFILNPPGKGYPLPNRSQDGRKAMAVILTDSINPSFGNNKIKELSYSEYFKWEMAQSLSELSQWYQIYFLLYSWDQYSNDLRMALDVKARMSGDSAPIIIEKQFDTLESLDAMGEFDLVVSMKFHGVIFSTIAATPFVNIGLTKKTELFCFENNLSNIAIPPRSFTHERLMAAIKEAEAPGVSEKLQAITQRNQLDLIAIRDQIAKDWLSSKGDQTKSSK